MYAFSRSTRAVLAAGALAALAAVLPVQGTASSVQGTATSDPRVCTTATPGGAAKHAYWCAKAAATDAVRKTMATRQHQARWFYPTFCTQTATLLRWNCTTTGGGRQWHGTVSFRHTASGWATAVALSETP